MVSITEGQSPVESYLRRHTTLNSECVRGLGCTIFRCKTVDGPGTASHAKDIYLAAYYPHLLMPPPLSVFISLYAKVYKPTPLIINPRFIVGKQLTSVFPGVRVRCDTQTSYSVQYVVAGAGTLSSWLPTRPGRSGCRKILS